MYADKITPSMEQAIDETNRRREIQVAHNLRNGIDPTPLRKRIADITDQLAREVVGRGTPGWSSLGGVSLYGPAAVTAGTTYRSSGLAPATTYRFTVLAYDAAGNQSAQSAAASTATSSAWKKPPRPTTRRAAPPPVHPPAAPVPRPRAGTGRTRGRGAGGGPLGAH